MTKELEIRDSVSGDLSAIEKLYAAAFPDEDLLPLVRELLQEGSVVRSLVGRIGSSLAGHIIFTTCSLSGSRDKVALLGPLAVAPSWQKQGIGSALIRAGLQQLEHQNMSWVYVLGDPAFYGRLGFAPEAHVLPPYALPEEWRDAWQSTSLVEGAARHKNKLCVPQPWRQTALWAP